MHPNRIFAIGAALGAAGIALGAFGAHGLKDTLAANGEQAVAAWDTAAQYQMIGAIAIMATGLLGHRLRCKGPAVAAVFLSLGVLFFSGSLYALSLLREAPPLALALLTPLGGVMLICGFVTLTLSSWADCGAKEVEDSSSD